MVGCQVVIFGENLSPSGFCAFFLFFKVSEYFKQFSPYFEIFFNVRKSLLRREKKRFFGEFSLSFSYQSFLYFHFDAPPKVREGGGNSGCPFTSRRVNQIIFHSSETDEEDADFLPGVALKPFLINRSQFGHLSLSPLDSVPPPQPPQYSHPRIVLVCSILSPNT